MPPRSRGTVATVLFALLSLTAMGLPALTRDSYYLDVAKTIAMNLILTMSWQLQVSTGQLNMAHISFMGIGAYASALLVMHGWLSFWGALPLAALLAAALAVPVGLIALRLTGPYFFLISFAFSEVARLFFNNSFQDLLGGPSGLVEIPKPTPLALFGQRIAFEGKLEQYYLVVGLFLLVGAVLVRLERSRFGLVCGAIRQQDLLASTLGVEVLRHKLTAFVLGSFMAGVAGSFFAHSHQVLHSSDFGLEPMVRLVIFTVIGGAGSVWGPVVGTVTLSIASEFLRELQAYETLVYGAVLMLTMLFVPDGLVSIPRRLRALFSRAGGGDEAARVGVGVAP